MDRMDHGKKQNACKNFPKIRNLYINKIQTQNGLIVTCDDVYLWTDMCYANLKFKASHQ